MLLRHVMNVLDAVDTPLANGNRIAELFPAGSSQQISVNRVDNGSHSTDFLKVFIPGQEGAHVGGQAPTLGVIGRLGGLGARPEQIGYVSDGDGAVAAIAAGLALANMNGQGDILAGDVVVTTHICPDAPTQPREPVPFMGSPVDMATMNRMEVDDRADALVSIDTTKGNRICNHQGIAITPPVQDGWILRPTDSVLDVYERVTGQPPVVLPLTTQDLTPYGNGVDHINSIMQPWLASRAPLIGVAVTAASIVPGSGTGASRETDIALAATFAVEIAKDFGRRLLTVVDHDEYTRLTQLYGSFTATLQGV